MKACELLQAFVAFFGQLNVHPTPVASIDAALNQRGRLASRNQRHNPVMLRLQAFGKLSYGCPFPAGKALDLEQQLILQRGYSPPARYLFTEAKITAQPIAKFSKPFQIVLGHVVVGLFCWLFFHSQCVSHCDTITQVRPSKTSRVFALSAP
jgi:hypothetical protein